MNYKCRNKNGITLIVLVVTIVILLILAGVSITITTGENGIIRKINQAKEKNEESEELEIVELAAQECLASGLGEIKAEELERALKVDAGTFSDKLEWEYVGKSSNYIIDSDGSVRKITGTSMSKSKFQNYTKEHIPHNIIFTNKGAENIEEKTDIGENEDEIYAWMQNETMYISALKNNVYVKAPKNCVVLFPGWTDEETKLRTGLVKVDLSYFDTSNTTTMSQMFAHCKDIEEINFGNGIKTANVTSMMQMFWNCSKLNTIVGNWDIRSVTTMETMFGGCESLVNFNLIFYNALNVENMHAMFSGCNSLITLDLGKMNTKKLTNMSAMFYSCSSLENINIENFNTSNITDMSWLFAHNTNLERIYVGDKWTTKNVTTSAGMFSGCSKLQNYSDSYTDKTYAYVGENGYLMFK